jgi:hypothetical protein
VQDADHGCHDVANIGVRQKSVKQTGTRFLADSHGAHIGSPIHNGDCAMTVEGGG